MNITVKKAKLHHIPQLEALEKLCFSLPWTSDQLETLITSEGNVFLVAENELANVLGYISLTGVLDEGYINNIAVAPDLRRQGIADLLLKTLISKAREKELSFLTLEVRSSNAPAIGLYEKHGFKPVGLRRNYYDKPTEDAVLMTLFL